MLPEEREKIITNARLAMEFADKMQDLKEKREQSLYAQVKEPTRILINKCFENEEFKLKKQYGVMQFESTGSQGYGRLYQEPKNNPVQGNRNADKAMLEKSVKETALALAKERKLTAQEASDRYLTYDEWKIGLTKAPDWVYNEGMASRSAKE